MPLKFEVRASPLHGKGLFAVSRIRAHTLLGVYEGRPTKRNGPHVLWVEDEWGQLQGIDGENELRYINHSSRPNAVFWGAELFSLCTILPGTEITFDYGEEWHDLDGIRQLPAAPATRACGSAARRARAR